MAQRGRIMIYRPDGTGTVSVANTTCDFDASRHWQSGVAPKANAIVDVELTEGGTVQWMRQVPVDVVAKEHALRTASLARSRGAQVWADARATLGMPVLVCLGLLLVGAFILSTINVNAGRGVSITYWQVLSVSGGRLENLATDGAALTLWRLLFLVAIVGCVASRFVSAPLAALGKCLPLAVILLHLALFSYQIYDGINAVSSMASGFGGAEFARMSQQITRQMTAQMLDALSLGLGFYVMLAAALGLAGLGFREWRGKRVVPAAA